MSKHGFILRRSVEMVSRRVYWLARSHMAFEGNPSCSSGPRLWLTRRIANLVGIGAWSRIPAGGYGCLVGVAEHAALIEAGVSATA